MISRRFLFLALAALTLVAPIPLHLWRLTGADLAPTALSASLRVLRPVTSADFDGDGQLETLSLVNGQATLASNGKIRWQSPAAWQVRQAEIADLNRDGQPEAVLLVWRPFKPWPVDQWLPQGGRIRNFQNAAGQACHLILIGWYQNAFRERWAGSALAEPLKAFAVADLAGTGQPVLAALEAEYADSPSAPARRLKIWEWNGFGFSVVSTLEGSFSQLALAQTFDGQNLILLP
jgi:hypothetical protein